MDIALKYPPHPEYASQLARLSVAAASEISGVDLDHSPESLKLVDSMLDRFSAADLAAESVASTLFCLGCYVGEVLIERLGGRWLETESSAMKSYSRWPLVVEMEDGHTWNPIGKVFKRFEDGKGESLHHFFAMAEAGSQVDSRRG